MATTIKEIIEIEKSVDEFSKKMKAVLSSKAARGKRGWNTMTESDLATILNEKLRWYYSDGTGGPQDEFSEEALLILANWCMFVYKAKKEKR